MAKFKKSSNPNRPGRAPAGCVWIRDKQSGEIKRNKKSELAYRPMTAAEKKDQAARKEAKKKPGRKKAAASQGASEITAAILLKKRTYGVLDYDGLLKARDILDSLVQRKKDAAIAALEAKIESDKEALARIKKGS